MTAGLVAIQFLTCLTITLMLPAFLGTLLFSLSLHPFIEEVRSEDPLHFFSSDFVSEVLDFLSVNLLYSV